MASDPNATDKEQPNIPKQDALSDLKLKFQKQLDVMAKLVRDQRKSERSKTVALELDVQSDEFRRVVVAIVQKHRSRYSDPTWPVGLPQFLKAIKNAETALDSLFDALKKLHPDAYNEIVFELAWDVDSLSNSSDKYELNKLLKEIAHLHTTTFLYSLVVPFTIERCCQPKTKSKKKNYSSSQYIDPVLDLIDLWRRLTGSDAVSAKKAKKTKGPQAAQNSTEFVRLGLTMIDVKLKPDEDQARKKATTAILSALKIDKSIQRRVKRNYKNFKFHRTKRGISFSYGGNLDADEPNK